MFYCRDGYCRSQKGFIPPVKNDIVYDQSNNGLTIKNVYEIDSMVARIENSKYFDPVILLPEKTVDPY